ncbi:bifunctional aspartate kinase/homoserine dehydrogenase I [Hymenobacter sp. GOD-10R]|uniref:bifunctional aspartate kinase/homoserine dehydrogenase I n=1 Tax=Hymenobacter sp. GOD-10R TaxID=3093922 RepID=UPI002D79B194|nr:bifunctional aspartate kinase/homoserine dehydrogenase I [Hymenobacter sp. GOD-10R]WRQ28729.1 bifunctional aspartate kinase/homoserine dehydrogenase I [Hymenobacter sp. GOD-10R]
MQVLKFGGTSVANAENINKVVQVVEAATQKDTTVVVVSALGGITDALIEAGTLAAAGQESYKEKLRLIEERHLETVKALIPVANQSAALSLVKKKCNELEGICDGVFLLGELSTRTLDRIMSFGEYVSSSLVAARLQALGIAHQWKNSCELIRTNSRFGFAEVDLATTYAQIADYVATTAQPLYVVPGFIASDGAGTTTTLGRGGSDYSAALFAAALNASSLEIWTDVSGMMTADPRLVSTARPISHISYQEAMELSHFGAKVLYPPTIHPVMHRGIPLWIKNTFAPDDYGTLVEVTPPPSQNVVRGISSMGNLALLSLEGSGMVGIPGFSKRLFEALSRELVNVVLITQSSSEHSISVAISALDADRAQTAANNEFAPEIAVHKLEPIHLERDLAIVAVVGENMKNHPGISGRKFAALGTNGVNIRAIAQGSSERNISTVIRASDVRKAINVLHEAFFETVYKQVNLFIVGIGNVGSKLLEQLAQQEAYLLEKLRLQVRVVAIANSKHFVANDEGLDLATWSTALADGEIMHLNEFVEMVRTKNLRNSIFVDVTASGEVAKTYAAVLEKSVSVVACNKVACSSPYASYANLKALARGYNAAFLFETNVGAGLPVIGTLNDLLRSGDVVHRIEAVLSGTLNFVFNNYDGTIPFADVVRRAQQEGYTEPDPRLDLGGTDVARKILILAREAGQVMEMDDITNESFLPASCMEGTVPEFYEQLAVHEAHFRRLYDEASADGKKLKFVARYADGKASVGLQHVGPDSDFYQLQGKDNVVLFYTNRYPEQPLVVKGAGAGADVTAAGVFADVMRAARI